MNTEVSSFIGILLFWVPLHDHRRGNATTDYSNVPVLGRPGTHTIEHWYHTPPGLDFTTERFRDAPRAEESEIVEKLT
jgi:hypothetical protein